MLEGLFSPEGLFPRNFWQFSVEFRASQSARRVASSFSSFVEGSRGCSIGRVFVECSMVILARGPVSKKPLAVFYRVSSFAECSKSCSYSLELRIVVEEF